MQSKWYSNGLSLEEVMKLKLEYVKIKSPYLKEFSTELRFCFEDEIFYINHVEIRDMNDIEKLMRNTKSLKVEYLENKIIEAYFNQDRQLKTISVDKRLI